MIYPNTEIFFTPSLYEKLKTKITFGSLITLTDLEIFNIHIDIRFLEKTKTFTLLSIKTLIKDGHLKQKILFY